MVRVIDHQSEAGKRVEVRNATVAASFVGVVLLLYLLIFGSTDIEESANTSYSAGATYQIDSSAGRSAGIHTIYGVPVFDTLQGTGDRLPYQGSWGQSVEWPLRFFVGWEYYAVLRTLIFFLPATYVTMRVLQSWLPRIAGWPLIVFGLLINSFFALYLRQNEWSDHYVQTQGVCAIAFFLMHRNFHEETTGARRLPDPQLIVCVFVMVSGVVAGHPGFWPVAFIVWSSILATFMTSMAFRRGIVYWLRTSPALIAICAGAAASLVAVVVWDLLTEMADLKWDLGRLERTQGLFSRFAFQSLYGSSDSGMFLTLLRRFAVSLLATTGMPLFILFDQLLPQSLRASSFDELPRVEFSGSIVIVAVALSWRAFTGKAVRSLIVRVVFVQILIWLWVVALTLDSVPTPLAASGAWMLHPVMLAMNVFLSFLIIGNKSWRRVLPVSLSVVNLMLVGYWCLFQFGFASFGGGMQIPQRIPSRFREVEVVHESLSISAARDAHGRALMSYQPSRYHSLALVTLGQPTVAPSDPKTRATGQLQSQSAFNFSIDDPLFETFTPAQVDRVLEFLQVRYLLIGQNNAPDKWTPMPLPKSLQQLTHQLGRPQTIRYTNFAYDMYSRRSFAVYVMSQVQATRIQTCPVLFEECPVVTSAERVALSSEPQLQMCKHDCLWTIRTPDVRSSDTLIVPVTFDDSLSVTDSRGKRFSTKSIGGYLGVSSAGGIAEGVLTIGIKPDMRMLARVIVSYLNLGTLLFLLIAISDKWVKSQRRRLRIE